MSDKIQIKDNLSLTVGKIADIKFLRVCDYFCKLIFL